jgi:hypothetical protein
MGCTISSAALKKQLGPSSLMLGSFAVEALLDPASGEIAVKLISDPPESASNFNSILMTVTVAGTPDATGIVGSFVGLGSDYRTKPCDPNYLDGVPSEPPRPVDSQE